MHTSGQYDHEVDLGQVLAETERVVEPELHAALGLVTRPVSVEHERRVRVLELVLEELEVEEGGHLVRLVLLAQLADQIGRHESEVERGRRIRA